MTVLWLRKNDKDQKITRKEFFLDSGGWSAHPEYLHVKFPFIVLLWAGGVMTGHICVEVLKLTGTCGDSADSSEPSLPRTATHLKINNNNKEDNMRELTAAPPRGLSCICHVKTPGFDMNDHK